MIAHALRADGFDAGEDGAGRGTPLTISVTQDSSPVAIEELSPALKIGTGLEMGQPPAIAFKIRQGCEGGGKGYLGRTDGAFTVSTHVDQHLLAPISLTTEQTPKFASDLAQTVTKGSPSGGGHPQAVALRGREGGNTAELSDIPSALRTGSGGSDKAHVLAAMAVRRLTPKECCRLQGFPDSYLDIPYRGKPAADGPRYKALGNSMAVPVMRWIGERIAFVETINA